jgi:hypothetical protein
VSPAVDPPDGSEVDEAIVALLAGDATLAGLMPDGVWFDVAGADATAFVLVRLLEHSDDYTFEPGRPQETATYVVQAVCLDSTATATARAAARRIHALLMTAPLAIESYACLAVLRQGRIRLTTYDPTGDIRWQHRGGHYVITVQPNLAVAEERGL